MIWYFLRKNWKIVTITVLVLALISSIKMLVANRSKYIREKNNVSALMSEIEHNKTIHGEDVTTIEELQLTIKELKKYREQDIKTIKELNLRPPQIKEIVKTVVKTEIQIKDSLVQVGPKCFEWVSNTKWWELQQELDFTLNPVSVEFKISIRDSLSHYLYKVPKFKLLGLRFGTSHYEIKCINHNPNSTIVYNEWINVSRRRSKRIRD